MKLDNENQASTDSDTWLRFSEVSVNARMRDALELFAKQSGCERRRYGGMSSELVSGLVLPSVPEELVHDSSERKGTASDELQAETGISQRFKRAAAQSGQR